MLLEVKNLCVEFQTRKGVIRAVSGVDFSLGKGETLAIVGESGSGKSVSAMSVLRLLDENGKITDGEILFDERGDNQPVDLAQLPVNKLCSVRGNRISVIFQEPMTALNPVLTIRKQLCEPLVIHRGMKKRQAYEEAEKMLERVGMSGAKRILKGYAHQLSGGQRQRVMIAMALACQPKILIADEPTTALDVTIQAQILGLMRRLQKENDTAILFITHDLGVVNETADNVAVMYCGRIMDYATKKQLFTDEQFSHPYTEGLMRSAPTSKNRGGRLECIEGNVPPPTDLPTGCKFSTRCKYCTQKCIDVDPPLFRMENGRQIRCFYFNKEERQSEKHRKLVVRRPS